MSIKAIDSTFNPNRDAMRRQGIDGKIRYIGPYRKAASPAEIRADRADRTLVRGYVIEGNADDVRKGAKLGMRRARQANAALDAAGEPLTTPVSWADDTSGRPADTLAFAAAFKAASKRPAGGYGSAGVIDINVEHGNIIEGWQTNARGWDAPRRWSPHATIRQELPAHLVGIGYVDPDVIADGSRLVVWPDGHPGAPTPVEWSAPVFPGHALRPGAINHDVAVAAVMLKLVGYHGFNLRGHSAEVYGAGKVRAIKRFQRRHNLVADGIIGKQTWAKLAERLTAKHFGRG